MRDIVSSLLDLLLPPRATERLVRSLTLEQLQNLGANSPAGEALPYHDPRVTALVWELKYYGTRRSSALAGAYLAEVVLAAASEELGVPLLIPVPMHRARKRERGHNQTELLCKAVLSALQSSRGAARPMLDYAPHALERIIDTKTQQGLPRQERLRNVKNSMRANRALVDSRACIVVDDVTTTGATLEEVQRALIQAGARAVHCIALARS